LALNYINKLFGKDEQNNNQLSRKVDKMYGNQTLNPFLKKNGELVNPYINYQKLMDSTKVNDRTKNYINRATGLTSTVQATDNQSKVEWNGGKVFGDNLTDNNIDDIGFISAKYESGGNGGTVAPDNGGLGYGISQFNTGSGSADKFVSWLKGKDTKMGSNFGNYKAGTDGFTNAWKKTFSEFGDSFTKLQKQFTYENFAVPLANLAKQKTGVDYTKSPALRELIYSTAVQFGTGELGLKALGNVSAGMSDKDIINASYDKKIANYKNFFKSSSSAVQEGVKKRFMNERNDVLALLTNNQTQTKQNTSSGRALKVGEKVADVSGYNNSAAKGQCVWYVRGRMKQKIGKDTGALGNGNQMWYNAKDSAKLAPNKQNIKPNTIASYQSGLSSGGKKYGHVIFIEDVVGDTVYYTEGGTSYYNNGTIGTLKSASKDEIINGSPKFGYGLIGFIDTSKY